RFMWALCIWREARGTGREGMLAVGWVMMNRLATKRWGLTMLDVVTARLQFSSMTAPGDSQTIIWPNTHCSPADLAAWRVAQDVVDLVIGAPSANDPTKGATFYFADTIDKPEWADSMRLVATIGNQEFFTV